MVKKERLDRYMRSLSIKEVVSEILSECVSAVCESEKSKKNRAEVKEDIVVPVEMKSCSTKSPEDWNRKRKYISCSWHDRSFAIYMLLKKNIFNGNVYTASRVLGIPRTTLCG